MPENQYHDTSTNYATMTSDELLILLKTEKENNASLNESLTKSLEENSRLQKKCQNLLTMQENLQKNYTSLESKSAEITKNFSEYVSSHTLTSSESASANEIKRLNSKTSRLETDLNEMNGALKQANDLISDLQKSKSRLEKSLNEKNEALKEVTILADRRFKYIFYVFFGMIILIVVLCIYYLFAQNSTQKNYEAQIQEYQIKLDEKTKEASEWWNRAKELENQLKNK